MSCESSWPVAVSAATSLSVCNRGGGGGGGGWAGGERERERENWNTLFYKDCSLDSVKNLTTSPF